MENSNMVIFTSSGKILKSINWLFIIVIALSIIGIGFLVYYNWENFKVWFQKKPKAINTDFSATITFDDKTSVLKVSVQSEEKQEFSLIISNNSKQIVSNNKMLELEQQFDLKHLLNGEYQCNVSNKQKAVAQIFEKK